MANILLETAITRLLDIQASLEGLHACVNAGSAASIQSASTSLVGLATAAREECNAVRRYIDELGASTMQDAVAILYERGDSEQAGAVLRLQSIVRSTARQQAGMEAFISECLNVLDTARVQADDMQRHGQLLGSA